MKPINMPVSHDGFRSRSTHSTLALLVITHDDRHFHLADRCINLSEVQIVDIEYSALNTQKIIGYG
jgi:ABC-type lipoprotein export system ATPase subunit